MSETRPCQMRIGRRTDCGNPARLCFAAESRGTIAICDECIKATGTHREYLDPVSTPAATTTDE